MQVDRKTHRGHQAGIRMHSEVFPSPHSFWGPVGAAYLSGYFL